MTNQLDQQTHSNSTLELADLALMANIIQVTSERGAIKAGEMQAVGALFSKLVSFVNANMPQTTPSTNNEAAASEGE